MLQVRQIQQVEALYYLCSSPKSLPIGLLFSAFVIWLVHRSCEGKKPDSSFLLQTSCETLWPLWQVPHQPLPLHQGILDLLLPDIRSHTKWFMPQDEPAAPRGSRAGCSTQLRGQQRKRFISEGTFIRPCRWLICNSSSTSGESYCELGGGLKGWMSQPALRTCVPLQRTRRKTQSGEPGVDLLLMLPRTSALTPTAQNWTKHLHPSTLCVNIISATGFPLVSQTAPSSSFPCQKETYTGLQVVLYQGMTAQALQGSSTTQSCITGFKWKALQLPASLPRRLKVLLRMWAAVFLLLDHWAWFSSCGCEDQYFLWNSGGKNVTVKRLGWIQAAPDRKEKGYNLNKGEKKKPTKNYVVFYRWASAEPQRMLLLLQTY